MKTRTVSHYFLPRLLQKKGTNMTLAENYYTADYPDEEVDTDDEYDRMAYHYRTGNASDMEEYDERDDEDFVLDDSNNDDTALPPARAGGRAPDAFFSPRGF